MKKIMIKIISYLKSFVREIDRTNKEDLIVELLTLSGSASSNIEVLKNVKIRFDKHLESKKETHLFEVEKIDSYREQEIVENFENCGYNIQFERK